MYLHTLSRVKNNSKPGMKNLGLPVTTLLSLRGSSFPPSLALLLVPASFPFFPSPRPLALLLWFSQILAIAFLLPGLLILPCPVTTNLGIKAKIPLVSSWEGIWPLLHIRWCFAGQELKFYKPHSWALYNFVRDHCYLGGGNKSISIFKLAVINYYDNLSWISFQIKKKAHLRFFIYSILQHCSFT